MAEKFHFSQEVLDYILKHENDDPYSLALKASPFANVSMKTIVQQIQGRKVANRKFPFLLNFNQYYYPVKESLEQASSEILARYKSKMVEGKSFVDLTGGMGVDTYLIGQKFESCTYIEPKEELYTLTSKNFETLGFSKCLTYNMTCELFLKTNTRVYDWAYIDPSRRIGGNRKISIHNYEPNLVEINAKIHDKANNLLVKLSPMQDVTECIDVLNNVYKIWIISVQNEVKELLLQLKENIASSPEIIAVDLKNEHILEFSYSFENRNCHVATVKPKRYLYQPGAALVKSELHNRYALKKGLEKLHSNTHLFTSEELHNEFFGRTFEIIKIISLNKNEIRNALPHMKANIITKNFPLSPQEIIRKFKLKEGGEDYLIAFTGDNDKKIVAVCKRVV